MEVDQRRRTASGTWTQGQLERMAASDELRIITSRQDGTQRRPVPIWVVRHGDAVYVRSFRGEDAVWYRSIRARRAARISAGGVDADVSVIGVADDDLNAEIDAAYRDKYGRYGPRFLDPMVSATARATTSKLVPRAEA